MKLSTIVSVVVVFLLSGASAAGLWVSGYLILLAPLGVFSPFGEIALALGLILSAAASAILVSVGKRSLRQRVILAIGVLAMASLPWTTPWRLNGFESRVKQTSDAEWLKIANDARDLLRATAPDGQLPRHPDSNWNRKYVAKLAESHSVLRLGDFPPKLFVTDDSVGVYWGSGLIGTLAVDISTEPSSEPPASDGFFRRKRISKHVTLTWE